VVEIDPIVSDRGKNISAYIFSTGVSVHDVGNESGLEQRLIFQELLAAF
jgi:hypothetical protein